MDDRRVVVIGTGPGAAMATLMLADAGIDTTVLESGLAPMKATLVRALGRDVVAKNPPIDLYVPTRHVTAGDPDARWTVRYTPGGLTNWWSGVTFRCAPSDFTDGERLHEKYRWPVTYEELVPFYEKAERVLGVAGTDEDVAGILPACQVARRTTLPSYWGSFGDAARRAGRGLTPVAFCNAKSWALTRTRGTWFNSFTDVIAPLAAARRCKLVLGAHALRLEWDGQAKRVTSVVYYDRTTRQEQRVTAAAVVVAAGALSTAQLLFASKCSDFPAGLGNDEDLVGRYLHDHPFQRFMIGLGRRFSPRTERLLNPTQDAYLTRRPYDQSPPLMDAAFLLRHRADRAEMVDAIVGTCNSTMVPTPENRVTLHEEQKDDIGVPFLKLDYRYSAETNANLDRGRESVCEVLESAGYVPTVRKHWNEPPGTSIDHSGVGRMHASPKYGVTDGRGRLHAVPNVALADGSVFTTCPEKNPTLTLMALAGHTADRLVHDLRSSAL